MIRNISDLVKKIDYNSKVLNIKSKYFITSDFDKLTSAIFNVEIRKEVN